MAKLQLLNALQCFEKAAKHLCFKSAAQELHVTPAAVSHQIKALEEHLGSALFIRQTRKVKLTPLGARLFPSINEGFHIIHQALAKETQPDNSHKLHIKTSPSFAGNWLVPRLPQLQSLHPHMDFLVRTSTDIKNNTADAPHELEVSIRYGYGNYADGTVEKIMDEQLMVVCTPEYLQAHPMKLEEHLLKVNLLHDAGMVEYFPEFPTWTHWFKKLGIQLNYELKGPRFESSNFTVQAAKSHLGVALARSALVMDDLKNGSLISPFNLQIDLPFAYYLVINEQDENDATVQSFRDWLRQSVKGGQDDIAT